MCIGATYMQDRDGILSLMHFLKTVQRYVASFRLFFLSHMSPLISGPHHAGLLQHVFQNVITICKNFQNMFSQHCAFYS